LAEAPQAGRVRGREAAPGRLFALACLLSCLLAPTPVAADDETLLAKARHFRDALVERHLSPEGMVLYRVNLETLRTDLESGRYPDLADTPTFTGLFAATSCLRASLETGAMREQALDDARRALEGLRFLMDVTGVRGLLARGARRVRAPQADEGAKKWLPGQGEFADYRWRGDVSMDQYANGLVSAVWACRGAYPREVAGLVRDAAAHLLANGMKLVDPDGEVTRFGDLSRRSGAGFNSIAQLTGYAIFALAAQLDDDVRWADQVERLRNRDRVPARSRTTNLRVFGITNYSNDLMAWNLHRVLVQLARETGDPALPDLRHGMYRSWLRVRGDGNPYFAASFCRVEPRDCDWRALREGRELLERFPLEKRKVAPTPELSRLPRRWLPGRKGRPQARRRVPIELRPPSSLEWKSSPYRLTGGTSPETEYTGLDFLAAYWLYRRVCEDAAPGPEAGKELPAPGAKPSLPARRPRSSPGR
jgi:hypothetical protein